MPLLSAVNNMTNSKAGKSRKLLPNSLKSVQQFFEKLQNRASE